MAPTTVAVLLAVRQVVDDVIGYPTALNWFLEHYSELRRTFFSWLPPIGLRDDQQNLFVLLSFVCAYLSASLSKTQFSYSRPWQFLAFLVSALLMFWHLLFEGTSIYYSVALGAPAFLMLAVLIFPPDAHWLGKRMLWAAALAVYLIALVVALVAWASGGFQNVYPWWWAYAPLAIVVTFSIGSIFAIRPFMVSLGWREDPVYHHEPHGYGHKIKRVGTRRSFDIPLYFFVISLLKVLFDFVVSVLLIILISLSLWSLRGLWE